MAVGPDGTRPVKLFPLALILACLAPATALRATPAPPSLEGQWQPDIAQNQQLAKDADANLRRNSPALLRSDGKTGERRGPPDGKGPPPGGGGGEGMDGQGPGGSGMGGGMGGPPSGGGGRGKGPPRGGRGDPNGPAPGQAMAQGGPLPPALDFAAPLVRNLVLYRTGQALILGNKTGSEVTVVPLSGPPAQLADGVSAQAHADGDALVMDLQGPDGSTTRYRYQRQDDQPDQLKVTVSIKGGPSDGYLVERFYHSPAPGG